MKSILSDDKITWVSSITQILWSALLGEITFFSPWENDDFTGNKIFLPQNNFAWREKMKLRSFFSLNILLGDEDGEYPAASLSLQQPAKGGNIYLGAWLLSVSLSCSCQFYSFDITKILSSRQQEEEIHYGSSKRVLFFLEFPFHRAENQISKFLPLLRREESFQNSITFWRNGCDFPSCSTWDVHWMFVQYKQHMASAMWWGSIVPSADETLTFQWLWAQNRRCFRMKEAAYEGCNLHWSFTKSSVKFWELPSEIPFVSQSLGFFSICYPLLVFSSGLSSFSFCHLSHYVSPPTFLSIEISFLGVWDKESVVFNPVFSW